MNKHSIDSLFKKKLADFEAPYPEHLWSNIDQRINVDPSNRKRGGMWISWLGLALLLVVATSLGYLWMTGEDANVPISALESTSVEEGLSDSELSSQINASQGKITGDNINSSDQASKNNESLENQIGSSTLSTTNTVQNNNTTNIREITSGEKTTKQIVGFGDGQNRLERTRGGLGKSSGDINSGNSGNVEPNASGTENFNNDLRSQKRVPEMEACSPVKMERTIEQKQEKRDIKHAVADLGGFGKRRFVGRWSIAAVYGPDWAFRSLEAKSNEGLALINQREKTESFANAFTTGLEVRLKMRQWSIHTGLHYSQINERNQYLVDGSEQMINGQLVKGDLTRIVFNRTKMVQIPLLIGYEVSRGPWAVELQAGGSYGLSSSSSGEVFDPTTLNYARYTNDSFNNPNSSKGQHSWQVGGMLTYKVGYSQQFFVRPYYRSYLNSFSRSEYGIDQKYENIGLTIGCRYLL